MFAENQDLFPQELDLYTRAALVARRAADVRLAMDCATSLVGVRIIIFLRGEIRKRCPCSQLCSVTCAENQDLFPQEFDLYTREELRKHVEQGTPATKLKGATEPHPECQFCVSLITCIALLSQCSCFQLCSTCSLPFCTSFSLYYFMVHALLSSLASFVG